MDETPSAVLPAVPTPNVRYDQTTYVAVVVPEGEDPDTYIPKVYVGNPIAPNKYCRGWNGKEDRMHYCGCIAGRGTDHKGAGRCSFHGGNKAITTGRRIRYGALADPTIRELYLKYREDPEPLQMFEELAILRARLEKVINDANYPEIRPTIEAIAKLVTQMDKRDHITGPEFIRLMLMMARVVADEVSDPEVRDRINDGWHRVVARRAALDE